MIFSVLLINFLMALKLSTIYKSIILLCCYIIYIVGAYFGEKKDQLV